MSGFRRPLAPPHPATLPLARAPHAATSVQPRARPGMPARPPHAATVVQPRAAGAPARGVVQRSVGVGVLQAMCQTLLGSYANAVEFQAMSIDTTVVVAANRSQGGMAALLVDYGDWDANTTTAMIGATVMADTGVARGRNIKQAVDASAAAEKLAQQGLIFLANDVEAGGNDLHAEQKLLHVLAERMRTIRPFGMNVTVAGRNPPCGSCAKVLTAFKLAYEDAGYGALTYDTTQGQARDVRKLNLSALYPDQEFRFGDFVSAYTRELARL